MACCSIFQAPLRTDLAAARTGAGAGPRLNPKATPRKPKARPRCPASAPCHVPGESWPRKAPFGRSRHRRTEGAMAHGRDATGSEGDGRRLGRCRKGARWVAPEEDGPPAAFSCCICCFLAAFGGPPSALGQGFSVDRKGSPLPHPGSSSFVAFKGH